MTRWISQLLMVLMNFKVFSSREFMSFSPQLQIYIDILLCFSFPAKNDRKHKRQRLRKSWKQRVMAPRFACSLEIYGRFQNGNLLNLKRETEGNAKRKVQKTCKCSWGWMNVCGLWRNSVRTWGNLEKTRAEILRSTRVFWMEIMQATLSSSHHKFLIFISFHFNHPPNETKKSKSDICQSKLCLSSPWTSNWRNSFNWFIMECLSSPQLIWRSNIKQWLRVIHV
jgi:hypothetical protein